MQTVQLHTLQSEFQRVNSQWLLKSQAPADILASHPQTHQLQTNAEKFQELSCSTLGIGGISDHSMGSQHVQWGDPQFSKSVAMVLGLLLATPQDGNSVSYELSGRGGPGLSTPSKTLMQDMGCQIVKMDIHSDHPAVQSNQGHGSRGTSPDLGHGLVIYLSIQPWSLSLQIGTDYGHPRDNNY